MSPIANDLAPLLRAITRAQQTYEVGVSPRALFDRMLFDLLELTSSEYGFIGEVRYDDEGKRFLKTFAITNIAWNDDTKKFYAENAPTGMEFRNQKTLFGAVLSTKEHVISNNPASDERRGGPPAGHPSLDAFLGAPFFHGGKFVGMVGIANRPGGYDEELLAWLQPFLTTCAGIIAVNRSWLVQVEVEESLRSAKNTAEAANKSKTQFLANMSHELRTPLNVIIGFTGILLKKKGEAKSHKLLERVRENGLNLLTLVDDILDVSCVEEGTIVPVLEDVDIDELIRSLFKDLQEYAGEKVSLIADVPKDALPMQTDVHRMRQIIVNLVINALKFTDEGSVTISVTLSESRTVESIQVEDTGIGIPPEDIERIFEPFQQVDNSKARNFGGAGLGLALSRSLAELLGFFLLVESTVGVGTKFRLLHKDS